MAEIKLTEDNFTTEVTQAAVPVLVDFWASWCGPCQMLGPIVAQVAEEAAGRFKVGKVNVDEEQELAARYNIEVIPTILVFKNGKVVNQAAGFMDKEALLELVK